MSSMDRKKTLATIRDVARAAGVSVATVSRYMNNSQLVAEETASRVKNAMLDLGFVPNPVARNLSTRRTNTIGLVISNIGGDFFTPLLDGIIETTEKENLNLLIFSSNRTDRYNHVLLGPMYTDGLLVFADSLGSEDMANLKELGHPMVLIHQSPPAGLSIPTVTIENKAASKRIVNHLIEKHDRKRIVFLTGPENNEDSFWREAGYREALIDHGLPLTPDLIEIGGFDRSIARQSIIRLIKKEIPFDAVFAGDDEAAIGVLLALKEYGRSVPEQVSVVGFDDQKLAEFLHPRLTTVCAPTQRVGITAAKLLIQIIQDQPVEDIILLPTELVIRNSCGCQIDNKKSDQID